LLTYFIFIKSIYIGVVNVIIDPLVIVAPKVTAAPAALTRVILFALTTPIRVSAGIALVTVEVQIIPGNRLDVVASGIVDAPFDAPVVEIDT
jgi:hypothetical protein